MTKTSNFRLSDATLADIDIVATKLGISRTEAICRGMAYYRATVTGLVPASAVEPPPSPVVPAEATTDDPGMIPDDAEVAVYYPAEPTPSPRREPLSRPTVGPVQSLRSRPITIADTPRVHRLLNPITKGRMP